MKISLTKEETLLLKGLAITAIVLHNFYHKYKGQIAENEFEFHTDSYAKFWNLALRPDIHLLTDFFSFYGHYGVTVFFFISGYGLVMKYQNLTDENFRSFISKQIQKLYSLLMPILLFLSAAFIFKGFIGYESHQAIHYIITNLTRIFYQAAFISNFIPEEALGLCGPWWFFSAILQLYVIYWLFLRHFSPSLLLFIAASCIIGQIFCSHYEAEYLPLIRYNFPAWLPTFILGMLCAKKNSVQIPSIVTFLLITICFLADANVYSWLAFSPLFFIVFIVFLKYVIQKNKILADTFRWLGKISASLFVINGWVRFICFKFFPTNECWNPYLLFAMGLVSLTLSISAAFFYQYYIVNKITKLIKQRYD